MQGWNMRRFSIKKTRVALAIVIFAFTTYGTVSPTIADTPGSIGSWTTSTNHLPLDISGATSVTYNGYIYVMGGTSSSTGNKSSAIYYSKLNSDGSVGSWTTSGNSLPQALYYPSATTANGYIYVMGGYAAGYQNTVYYAKINSDGSVGSWTTSGNSLPQAIYEAVSPQQQITATSIS